MNKTLKTYPIGQVTNNYAWIVAKRLGKRPPYRGYALDLQNGQRLVCPPTGGYFIEQTQPEKATP